MNIQNIVSFGCSWTYGDELIDPILEKQGTPSHYTENDPYRLEHCYSGLLAKHYNLQQENLSFPGSSLQAMQWNLMWWLNNHTNEYISQSMIIVGLTEEHRVSWYDPNHERASDDPPWNNYLHAQWLDGAGANVDKGWFKLHKYYLGLSDCTELYQLNYETTVRLFDGLSSTHNIPIIQFNAMTAMRRYQHLRDSCDTLYDIEGKAVLSHKSNVYKNGGHPNEKGHQLIANSLIEVIDNSPTIFPL